MLPKKLEKQAKNALSDTNVEDALVNAAEEVFSRTHLSSSECSHDAGGASHQTSSVTRLKPESAAINNSSMAANPPSESGRCNTFSSHSSEREHASATTHSGDTPINQVASVESGASPPRSLYSVVRDGLGPISVTSRSFRESEQCNNPVPGSPTVTGNAGSDQSLEPGVLQQQSQQENRQENPHGNPGRQFIRVLELGRVRRKMRTLDLEHAEMTKIASDLTTLVPLPQAQDAQMQGHSNVAIDEQEALFFRDRIARVTHRRLAWLRLHGKEGSVRSIEDWYREAAQLVGYRDQEEADLPWSWQENEGYF